MSQDHNWAESEAGFRRAIELKPGYATAYHWLALCLAGQGRTDEAIAEARKAEELDPVSLTPHTFLAQCLLWARRYDEAISQCLDALELHPDAAAPRVILAECYWRTGNIVQALAELDKVKPHWQDDPRKLAVTRALFTGDKEAARRSLADLLSAKLEESDPMFCAQFKALLGDPDSAFRYLEAAYARHDSGLLVLNVDPTFDTLRSDPRFGSLAERMGLRRR
jgi:tetratricopeptide (TPR) repeat protein